MASSSFNYHHKKENPDATSSPPNQSFEEKRYSLWLQNTPTFNNNNNTNTNNILASAADDQNNKSVKLKKKTVVKRVVKKLVRKKVKKEATHDGDFVLLQSECFINNNDNNTTVSCSDELVNPKTDFVTDANSNAEDKFRVVEKEENNGDFGLLEFEINKKNTASCSAEFVNPKSDTVTDVNCTAEDKIRVVEKEVTNGEFGLLEFERNKDTVSCSDVLVNSKSDDVTDVSSKMEDQIRVLKKLEKNDSTGDFGKLGVGNEADAKRNKNIVSCSNNVRSPNCNIVNDKTRGMKRVKLGADGDAGTESTVSSSGEVRTPDYEIINSFIANKEDKTRVDMATKGAKREENDAELRKMEVDNEASFNDDTKIRVMRAIEIVQNLRSDDAVSGASTSIESDNDASGKVAVIQVKNDTGAINKDEKKVRVVKKNAVMKRPKKVKKEEIPNTLEFRNGDADIANSHVPNLSLDKNNGSNVDDMETENENSFYNTSDNVNIIANKEENNVMVERLGSEGNEGMEGDLMMPGDMVLCAEMEVLERRKRRKTQIFLGGLDKDAVEEDVRKVFQEIGEIVEVTVKMNERNGKNKGFAFIRYASAADAKKAVEKSGKVEIFGKKCSVEFMKGNDTIYLGNLDKTWKNEDIFKLLQDAGVDKIDKVTIKPDPEKPECNVGYAFLELETIRDAQITFGLLEKRSFLGNKKIRVEWAKQLSEADEEEMYKVKTVYAEYLPGSWDEEAVKDYFKKFGDVENVVLARNLVTYKRKDFAFINYKSREAALACIRAFTSDSSQNENSKVKVQLAKSTPKIKQVKHAHVLNRRSLEKPKAAQTVVHPFQSRSKALSANHFYDNIRIDVQPHIRNKGESTSDLCENSQSTTSTNDELVQLLREQASWRPPQTSLSVGSTGLDLTNSLPTRKRQYFLGDPNYSDIRGYPRPRTDISLLNPSVIYPDVEIQSLPHYHRHGLSYPSGLPYDVDSFLDSSQSQTRGASPGVGSGVYRRY